MNDELARFALGILLVADSTVHGLDGGDRGYLPFGEDQTAGATRDQTNTGSAEIIKVKAA